jgi:hypothetical protein
MEHLNEFKVKREDIIQKERLISLFQNKNIRHIGYHEYFQISKINEKTVFFHLGDEPFTTLRTRKLPRDFEKVFSVNCETDDKRVVAIPLGLTDTSHCPLIGDLDIIVEFSGKEKVIKNLAYINFNIERKDAGWNDRMEIKRKFGGELWVKEGKFERNVGGHRKFISEIYESKFVFCPRGNGVDTHRLWMSLYLNSIPIVKDHPTYKTFKHLPIIFVKEWSEVNEKMLNQKWEEMNTKKYDFSIMKMSYYL